MISFWVSVSKHELRELERLKLHGKTKGYTHIVAVYLCREAPHRHQAKVNVFNLKQDTFLLSKLSEYDKCQLC